MQTYLPSLERSSRQRGNALFLILIAVALFAALSYAVTTSGRGSGTVNKEQAQLTAAAVVQQAGLIGQAITRMKLVNRCSDTQISFENPVVTGYANAGAPLDKSCNLFDAAGGALSFPKPTSRANQGENWLFSSGRMYKLNGDIGLTTDSTELLMILPNISLAICQAINAKMTSDPSFAITPPTNNGGFHQFGSPFKFDGTYVAVGLDTTTDVPPFDGTTVELAACAKASGGVEVGQYWFFYILLARQP